MNTTHIAPAPQSTVAQPTTTKRRLGRMLAVALPVTFVLIYLFGWISAARSGGVETVVRHADFVSTLTGARIINEGNGAHLYELNVQRAAQARVLAPYIKADPNRLLPYNHIPFEALLITPLMAAGMSYPLIFGLWTLLMAAALGLALWVMQRALPVRGAVLPLLALALVSYQPVLRSFFLGQNSPLVLLGLCLVYALTRRKLEGWAGVALLLVALKPQILPAVGLVLLLQWRWKTLLAFGGSLLALSVAVMPVLGVGWPVQYVKLLVGVAGWQDTGAISPAIMHNWRGFATDLLGVLAPGLVTPLFGLLTLLSVGLIVAVWYGARKMDTAAEEEPYPAYRPGFDLLWAVVGIVAVLTSLHLNPHDLTLLLFPAWIVAAYAFSGRWAAGVSGRWVAVLWTGWLVMHLTFFISSLADNPALSVVPNVLLVAGAAVALARQREVGSGAQPA